MADSSLHQRIFMPSLDIVLRFVSEHILSFLDVNICVRELEPGCVDIEEMERECNSPKTNLKKQVWWKTFHCFTSLSRKYFIFLFVIHSYILFVKW